MIVCEMMKKKRMSYGTWCDRWSLMLRVGFCVSALLAGPWTVTALAQADGAEEAKDSVAQPTAGDAADEEVALQDERSPAARRGPRRDRIGELVKSLDPAVLNRLIGADVDVEFIGGQVILKGPEEAVIALELLIKALDREVEQKVLRVVQVTERDAKEIARTVQEAIRDATRTPTQRPEDEVTITALSSTVLLVAALPRDIDWVIDVIKQVDAVPPELGEIQKMTFQVKHRRASDVAADLEEIIQRLLAARGERLDQSKIQIIPNNANNTVMVIAPTTEREKIQALIDEIDVEPVKGWGEVKLTIFPLIHSKAAELSEVINNLLTSTGRSQQDRQATEEVIYRLSISKASPTGEITELPPIDLQKPMRIIPDPGTNSLIVATVEENVGPLGELIRLMDGVPMAEDVDVKLFPLRFADAETLRDLLQSMFDKGKELPQDPDGSGSDGVPAGDIGRSLVYDVGIVADPRTNTLIATGRPEQLVLVETIVGQLDRPATALRFPLRILSLEHVDVTRIAQLIGDLFEKRFESAQATGANQMSLERERVFLSVDIRGNSLIVSASDENYAEIVRIARQLDTRPAKVFDQIRLVICKRLPGKELKEKIDELWQRKSDLRREGELPEDKPVVVVDERSNALIIASSLEDYEEIKTLVEALESRPRVDDTKLFKLAYTDATVLAGMLDQLFEGIARQFESFEAPTIMPDPRSNTLVVAASRDTMERVEELIERLDVEAGPNTAVFKVYPLHYGWAAKLGPRMQQLFDSRAEGRDTPGTPIVILPEESSNSLVCSASRDDHRVIVELLSLLDKPSNLARHFEIFPLKMAKAPAVAEKLASLFASQGDGASGRADAIAVEPDERTNSLIVWASPSDMTNIAEVIGRLDTALPVVEMMVKVIQLKQALATDFATLLSETVLGGNGGGDEEQAIIISFLEKRPDGTETLRKLLRQDIRVQPDPRTNSLMVMAPGESMAMLEAMIHDFDRIRPVTSEIRLFPLINSDAGAMVSQLEELFQPSGAAGEGEMQSQLVFGDEVDGLDLASVGQELRFTSDPRTNTLIAAGAEVYLRMVEELVRWLDQQEVEDRVVEVYQARYMDAQDLAAAVQGFVQQEQEVLGETDDETSRMRRQERQISVESLGEEGEGSSQLIIGTSRRAYQRTMDMIRELDRPEPQVMITVLIAEVTLSNDIELGIEIAGQDLRFTENAVLGPNGVIQGSNFDYVLGTDLGAAGLGLGGFNFTVTGEDFSFLLHALQTDSRLEVLSRPILLVRNGQEGNITIADQVPFVQSSQINDTGSTNSIIGREDVGIVLTVTPHISPEGYVTIALRQELSNLAGENVQLTEGVASPVFQTRELETNVTVRDGETVVIGGLITTRESLAESKVPILGDLPLIGFLFRRTSVSKTKSELLIVLTVDILRTDEDVYQMSVEQRDKFVLPDSIRQSPLMEGLRIVPEDKTLGPVRPSSALPQGAQQEPGRRPDERNLYGPKPKVYGPPIKSSTTTSAASGPVYGPRVALNEMGTRND